MGMDAGETTFFCGIGGSGMSALAQVLRHRGVAVAGSDRSFDQGRGGHIREALEAQGVRMWPQDGSGVADGVGRLIVSTAVERTIPDVRVALERGIPVVHRAELLAEVLHGSGVGIAIGGTSGKSTVTAMVGHILERLGRAPTVINGAVMIGAAEGPRLGNIRCGGGELTVIEADESDGSIANYLPSVGVITNITLDHKPMPELRALFGGFAGACGEAVVLNADCAESGRLGEGLRHVVRFGVAAESDVRVEGIRPLADGVACRIGGEAVRLGVLGEHNAVNAAAAVAAVTALGIEVGEAVGALRDFAGVERRLQILGEREGVLVIDDFGHNPEKIAASLSALRATGRRLVVMFQPHGYGPTRFLRDGLVRAFREGLREEDLLVMPEIFYAGGTAAKDISSAELVREIAAGGRRAVFAEDRAGARRVLLEAVRPGDALVIMGARDTSLTLLARGLLEGVGE